MWNRLRATAFAALVFVVLAFAASLAELSPPPVVSADASPDVFSAERAHRVVREIARAPHPPNTPEHDRVRGWLLDELGGQGLDPEVHETVVVKDDGDDGDGADGDPKRLRATRVRNILARLPGTGDGKAVLLLAHYDSVPTGPGAGDDAAGVATLLETLRALRAGPPLARDVLFLVTDAEEQGLMGARAFVREHPLREQVGVVLNFEARGRRGPSVMFETSRRNGGLIETFAEVAPHPVANAASAEVYRLMPNDTDLSVFLDEGVPGLNFAFFGDVSHYHTMLDTPAALDLRSLQQHGDAALALTRAFAAADLDDEAFTHAADRTYVSLLGSFVLHYPTWLSWPLLLAGLALLGYGVRLGARAGRLSRRGLALGVLVPCLSAPLGALAALAIQAVFGAVPRAGHPPSPQVLHDGAAAYPGILLLVLSIHSLVVLKIRPDSKVDGLWAGALLLCGVVGVIATAVAPGLSVVFAWPLLFGSAGFCLLLLRPDRRRVGAVGFVTASVAVLPVFVIGVPLVGMLAETVTLLGAFLVALVTASFLSLLAPHVLFLTTIRKWGLTIVSGLLGFSLLARAILIGGTSDERPEWDSLVYTTDGATAEWVSFDDDVDVFTGVFLGDAPNRGPREDLFPGFERPVLTAPAPALALPAAEVEVVAARLGDGVRTVRLRCRVPAGTVHFGLDVGGEHHVRLLALDGRPVDAPEEGASPFEPDASPTGLRLRFSAPPPEFELELALRAEGTVPITTRVSMEGLPEAGMGRPEGIVPRPNLPDRTIVRRGGGV